MRRPTLRVVLFVTAALAGAKIWTQDRFHQSIYDDALIAAYQDKAMSTCQRELKRNWARLGDVRLSPLGIRIGNPNTSVALWDFDNPLWNVRYRHPQLLLSAEPQGEVGCAFDIVAGLADINVTSR